MKKIKRFIIINTALMLSCVSAIAEPSLETLLQGYLENDLNLRNLSAEYKKQVLSDKSSDLQNGVGIKLSSGKIMMKFTDDNFSLSMTPEVSVSLPMLSNMSISGSTSVKISSAEESNKPGNNSSNGSGVSNTTIKLSADVFSSTAEKRNITLLKSDRKVLEAKRSLENRFLEAEKEFYNELKSLYDLAVKVNTEEKSLYDAKTSFDQVVAQGYSTSSSKYKNTKMTVLTNERNVENAKLKLERQVRIFASECGVEYNEKDPADFLPKSIPSVEPIDVLSFSQEDYKSIESAKWNSYINELTRKAEKDVSVTANAAYTFKDSSSNDADSVSVGGNLKWNNTGLVFGTDVSMPIKENTSPSVSFSISIDPTAFITSKIDDETQDLSIVQEQITYEKALQNYNTDVISRQTELNDLNWNKKTTAETYALYKELAAEQLASYKAGIITESEYRSSVINEEKYRVQCLINAIEFIVYNDTTQLLFVRDAVESDSSEAVELYE